jgi:glycosyltransferase involved in cell wall biosynthesis
MPPELLLLCEYATLNGGERSMLATLDDVRAAGLSVAVMAPPEGPLAEALHARGIEVEPFRTHDPAGRRWPLEQLRRDLAARLRGRRVDLLDANSLSMGRLSGPVAAALGLPSVAHLRDIIRLSRQAIADLNCHARLLAVSQATRDYHLAGGLSADKTRVVYNGVDLARFAPRPASGWLHAQLGLPPQSRLVGAIGQIGLRKGHDVLVRAALVLAQAALPVAPAAGDVHYVIVGRRCSDKPESRRLEADLQAAAAGPLAGRLHFLGVRDDVERILNELTLLVHPARQEPLGRVLLEAAAAGLAVIASDVGGTREIFPPESASARLVPPDDPQALAAAMGELLGDAGLRSRLAAAARRRAEQAFGARRAAEELIGHYRAVCGGCQRG